MGTVASRAAGTVIQARSIPGVLRKILQIPVPGQ